MRKILNLCLAMLILLMSCTFTFTVSAAAEEETEAPAITIPDAEEGVIRVLAIGNSYSSDAQRYTHEIAKSLGLNVEFYNLYYGGCTIEQHYTFYLSDKANYDFYRNMKRYVDEKVTIKSVLEATQYDYITFQQGSASSDNYNTYLVLDELMAKVRKHQPNAEFLIHQTWGYCEARACNGDKEHAGGKGYATSAAMFEAVEKCYARAAADNGNLRIIKSGKAVEIAKTQYSPTYTDDYGNETSIYSDFNSHLSKKGDYLAGCVWVGTIFNVDIRDATYTASLADTEILRSIAYTAIGDIHPDIVTVDTKNDDGSITKTTTDKLSGTTTKVTTNTDGSLVTVETKKDGTGITTKTSADGETTAEIKVNGEAEVIIPIGDTEDVSEIVVTYKNGNKTVITDFEVVDGGIAVTVSGNASVSISKGTRKVFADVHSVNHWATTDVDYTCTKGLMKGTSETHFSPDTPLTRAMLVTVLYRLEGEPAATESLPFADVDAQAYYANAVSWAKQNGIVNGVSETEFAPDNNITREQIATIIYRYAALKGYDAASGENTSILSYSDFDSISEYAVSSMQYACGSGLIKGKSDSTLNPKDNATRAEAAAILHRFIKAN